MSVFLIIRPTASCDVWNYGIYSIWSARVDPLNPISPTSPVEAHVREMADCVLLMLSSEFPMMHPADLLSVGLTVTATLMRTILIASPDHTAREYNMRSIEAALMRLYAVLTPFQTTPTVTH